MICFSFGLPSSSETDYFVGVFFFCWTQISRATCHEFGFEHPSAECVEVSVCVRYFIGILVEMEHSRAHLCPLTIKRMWFVDFRTHVLMAMAHTRIHLKCYCFHSVSIYISAQIIKFEPNRPTVLRSKTHASHSKVEKVADERNSYQELKLIAWMCVCLHFFHCHIGSFGFPRIRALCSFVDFLS